MPDYPLQQGEKPGQSRNPSHTNTPPAGTATGDTIFCSRCGEKNLENNYKCTRCGHPLHGSPTQQVIVTNEETLGGLIPIKNKQALISYYLGIFAIIPILGIPLGIVAVILGIRGLSFARMHPEVKGAIHAWVGVLVGGFFSIAYLLLIATPIFLSL